MPEHYPGYTLEVVRVARQVLAEVPSLYEIPTPHAEHTGDVCATCDAYRLLDALTDAARALGREDKATVAEMLTAFEQIASPKPWDFAADAAALGRWAFVAIRERDSYQTLVTVPVAEHPTLGAALRRVEEEFGKSWRVAVIDPGHEGG